MFYWLYELLAEYDIPGLGMLPGITFRAAAAIILSLFITTVFGKKMIRILQRKQIGDEVRDLGLEGQMQKQGTPTMGGIIILMAIIIPTLLFAQLDNIYVIDGSKRSKKANAYFTGLGMKKRIVLYDTPDGRYTRQ